MESRHTLSVEGFSILRLLGTGGKSTLWEIEREIDNKRYALKRYIRKNFRDNKTVAQAENEYQLAQKLHHKNIRRVLEIQYQKRLFALREVHLILELCEGKTIREQRPTKISTIVHLFSQIGEALSYMNSRGILHADLKPDNIMICPKGRAKIIDLDLSCPVGTTKKRIQGTPDFISPEQITRRPLTVQTDIFGFGATLYWTLTGTPIPTFKPKKSSNSLISQVSIRPPQDFAPEIPSWLSELLLDCVQVHPEDRPASMDRVLSRFK